MCMLSSSAITLMMYAITLTKLFVVGILITVVSWLAGWWQFTVAAALVTRGLTGIVLVSGPATVSCSGSMPVSVVGRGCDSTWLQQGLNNRRHNIGNIRHCQRAIYFSFLLGSFTAACMLSLLACCSQRLWTWSLLSCLPCNTRGGFLLSNLSGFLPTPSPLYIVVTRNS